MSLKKCFFCGGSEELRIVEGRYTCSSCRKKIHLKLEKSDSGDTEEFESPLPLILVDRDFEEKPPKPRFRED